MTATHLISRLRARLTAETGSMLIELLIAMMFLSVAVGALVSVYASSMASLTHASIEGNALSLAEKQMESFRASGSYSSMSLSAASVPAASDVYATDPPSNLSPAQRASITSGQLMGGAYPATQLTTGPDNRQYRIDTYIFPITPPNGQVGRQVSVAVRLVQGSTVGRVRARVVSTIDIGTTRSAT